MLFLLREDAMIRRAGEHPQADRWRGRSMAAASGDGKDAGAGSAGGGSSPFWIFSLKVYRSPAVQAACLELQDGSGVDVNVLLFMLWLGSLGRYLTTDEVRGVVDAVEPWRCDVVVPLRSARRALKTPPAAFQGSAGEALRAQVKRAELESERMQQDVLFQLSGKGLGSAGADPGVAAAANVAGYATVLGRVFPTEPVSTMLAATSAA